MSALYFIGRCDINVKFYHNRVPLAQTINISTKLVFGLNTRFYLYINSTLRSHIYRLYLKQMAIAILEYTFSATPTPMPSA